MAAGCHQTHQPSPAAGDRARPELPCLHLGSTASADQRGGSRSEVPDVRPDGLARAAHLFRTRPHQRRQRRSSAPEPAAPVPELSLADGNLPWPQHAEATFTGSDSAEYLVEAPVSQLARGTRLKPGALRVRVPPGAPLDQRPGQGTVRFRHREAIHLQQRLDARSRSFDLFRSQQAF